jgi:hypothetical protein
MEKDWEGPLGVEGIQEIQNISDDGNSGKEQSSVSKMLEIAGNTIGFGLIRETPSGRPGISYGEQLSKEQRMSESWKRWQERENSKKPYVLTKEEREIVKELLGMDDEFLDIHDVYIYDDGEICIKSPDYTWRSLCGSEWNVNLQEKTAKCVALS